MYVRRKSIIGGGGVSIYSYQFPKFPLFNSYYEIISGVPNIKVGGTPGYGLAFGEMGK